MRIEVSREEVLLDTGGGLKKAAYFFLEDPGRSDEPFIVHNVDVISTIDLGRMVQVSYGKPGARHPRGERPGDHAISCSSTINSSFAAGNTGAIKSLNLCALHPMRRRWLFPASTLFLLACWR